MKKVFRSLPVIKTKRLILRKLTSADAGDIYAYAGNPEVSRYTLWRPHSSLAQTRRFIANVRKNYRSGSPENWGIEDRADAKLIGTIGFFYYDALNRKGEIHYALSQKYSGQGLMSEAVKAVMRFGFTRLRLNRIEAKCMPDNKASERVMQKCGMRYEGLMRKALLAKGRFVDLKAYAILKSEFSGRIK